MWMTAALPRLMSGTEGNFTPAELLLSGGSWLPEETGVDPAVAEKAIEEEYDEDTQRQTLRRLMVKAAAAMPEDEAAAAAYRRRIARRFIAKGFSQGMVFDELKDILL